MSKMHVTLLVILLQAHLARARRTERGASAVEWVIITAILVILAGGIGFTISQKVTDKANGINLGP